MNSSIRPLAMLLALAGALITVSCDSGSSGSGPSDPLTTNFSVNLSTLIDSLHGLPDSIVAEVRIDQGEARKILIEPAKISESGLIHFPVDAAEGSKVEVFYKVWKNGGIEGASTVKWISGEPLTVPRPDLAPTIAFDGVPGKSVVLRRDAKIWIRLLSRDPEGALSAIHVDWNGDGTMDDSLVPPKGRDSLLVSWGEAGTFHVEGWVKDRSGLRRRDTLLVRVLAAAKVSLSPDTLVSIRDSFALRVGLDLDDSTKRTGVRLVWTGLSATPETTSVASTRRVAWAEPGTRRVVVSSIDEAGLASTDSVRVEVVQDPPVLDLSRIPGQIDLGSVALLPVGADQRFGRIVRWGIDFDGDTANRWDSTMIGSPAPVAHLFPRAGTFLVRVFAIDDDSNRVVGNKEVWVASSSSGQVLRRVSGQDTIVSVDDTVEVRYVRNFAPGEEAQAVLEWKQDDGPIRSQPIGVVKRLAWSASGTHRFSWRVAMPSGATLWDTVHVQVEQDPPSLDRENFPVTASLNAPKSFAPRAIQRFGTLVRWGLDLDNDTTGGWDTVVAGRSGSVLHTFSREGVQPVLVFLEDDDGNRVVESVALQVKADGLDLLLRTSDARQEVSIGDSASVSFRTNLSPGLATSYAVEWMLDGAPVETASVASRRSFVWGDAGDHLLRFRAIGPGGAAGWDSTRIQVVRGVPVVRTVKTLGAGVGKPILFSAVVDPVYGSIVKTRWDFGNDGTWDDSTTGPEDQVDHLFETAAKVEIRLQARDDDGNLVDTVFFFEPSNSPPAFGLAAFTEEFVGMSVAAVLRASFTDPDGLPDLSSLSIDWDGDGTWDTVRNVSGLGSDEIRHSWSDPGRKVVRVKVADKSGSEDLDSAVIVVRANAPRILSFRETDGRRIARLGDTLWFVASISDSSTPPDLESIRWRRDGLSDSVVSLRGFSTLDTRIPMTSNRVGSHSVSLSVRDAVGNIDSANLTWESVLSPPFVASHLRDTLLVARDTVTLTLDSLRAGSLGGRVAGVDWSLEGASTWTTVPSPSQGVSTILRLPNGGATSLRIVVRARQDNGEVAYDTLSTELLPSFVDPRDGTVYPYVTVGTTTWMARNLSWKPSVNDSVLSTCAVDGRCVDLGRLYSAPVPLLDQPASTGAPRSISVCPDGWRLPSDLEFNELIETGRGRYPSLSYAEILRARTGWATPVATQTDPLRFGALPTLAYNAEQFTAWWTYSQQPYPDANPPFYPDNMNQSLRVLSTEDLNHATKYGFPSGASVRCVRLKEIIIDTSWKPAAPSFDSSWMPKLILRGLVPEASVAVRIQATLDGETVETVTTPSGHELPWTSLPQFTFHEAGTFPVTLEVRQGNVVFQDTVEMVITANP